MWKEKRKRVFSIRIFISMAFNLIVAATGLLLCIFVFIYIRNELRDNLYIRLNDLSYTIARNIDGDKFEKITSTKDPLSIENYRYIQNRLQDIQQNTTKIFYIYSMRINSRGENVFVVPTDDDQGFMGWFDVPYNEIHEDALKLYENPGVIVIKSFIEDEYGTWVSGFASILNSKGKIVGVVGIDVSAEDVIKSEIRCLVIMIMITAAIVVVVLFLGRFFSGMITRPLLRLQDEIGMIQKFELEDVVPSDTIFIEIRDMENVVDRTKKALRSFKRYVPSELVHQIVLTQKEAVLSGDELTATFMFTDIEGFTSISEGVDIESLVEKMGSYFEIMTKSIHQNSGTVDKYIGDAVMAFWGAPNYLEQHAFLACKTALECLESVEKLNAELIEQNFPPLNTRLGIHTGKAIIGNMGYSERLNYTAIGDTVNMASRLEGINKFYDTNILISDDTYNMVKDEFVTRRLDRIIFKGKTGWITVHELLGVRGGTDPDLVRFADAYNRAIELFYAMEWEDAELLFSKAERIRRGDRASLRMIKYCQQYMENPPPEKWKGIVKLNSK